jgi:hypothetical protein
MTNIWVTALTSAAVGVLVSRVLTLVGQYLERRARRNELLLQEALKLAAAKTKLAMDVVEKGGGTASLVDDAINAEVYFRWLKSLLETGKLPRDAERGRRPNHPTPG